MNRKGSRKGERLIKFFIGRVVIFVSFIFVEGEGLTAIQFHPEPGTILMRRFAH